MRSLNDYIGKTGLNNKEDKGLTLEDIVFKDKRFEKFKNNKDFNLIQASIFIKYEKNCKKCQEDNTKDYKEKVNNCENYSHRGCFCLFDQNSGQFLHKMCPYSEKEYLDRVILNNVFVFEKFLSTKEFKNSYSERFLSLSFDFYKDKLLSYNKNGTKDKLIFKKLPPIEEQLIFGRYCNIINDITKDNKCFNIMGSKNIGKSYFLDTIASYYGSLGKKCFIFNMLDFMSYYDRSICDKKDRLIEYIKQCDVLLIDNFDSFDGGGVSFYFLKQLYNILLDRSKYNKLLYTVCNSDGYHLLCEKTLVKSEFFDKMYFDIMSTLDSIVEHYNLNNGLKM